MSGASENVHATGLVVGGTGILLRGPPGSGKSLLALLLLDSDYNGRREAVLVADDRIDLVREGTVVTMHAPPALAGLIELRGRGILTRLHRSPAPVHLVVDLVETLERMPEESAFCTELLGVTMRRCPVPRSGVVAVAHQLLLVREALAEQPRPNN